MKIPRKFEPALPTFEMVNKRNPLDVLSLCADHAVHFLTVDKYKKVGPSATRACDHCAEFSGACPGNGYPTDDPKFQPRADASADTLVLSGERRLQQAISCLRYGLKHCRDAAKLFRAARRRRMVP